MRDDPRSPDRRLVAGVVHELNNALTAIVGLAEKLEGEERLDDDTRGQIAVIAAQGRRLRHLSDRLAAFARGEAISAADASPPAARPLLSSPGPPLQPSPAGAVLLVDDEEMIRTVVSWQLQGMGHEVIAVDSAESALDAYDADPGRFQLALIDVVLPGRSGTELARQLRSRRLPVILLSGTPMDQQSAADALPCLLKPVPLLDLQRAVADALSPQPARGSESP